MFRNMQKLKLNSKTFPVILKNKSLLKGKVFFNKIEGKNMPLKN